MCYSRKKTPTTEHGDLGIVPHPASTVEFRMKGVSAIIEIANRQKIMTRA